MVTNDPAARVARRRAEDLRAYLRTAARAVHDAVEEADWLLAHHNHLADRTEPATCAGWALADDGTITITADDGHQTRIPPGELGEMLAAFSRTRMWLYLLEVHRG